MDANDNCKVKFGGSGKLFEPMDQITNDAVYLAFPNPTGLSFYLKHPKLLTFIYN